MPWVVNQFRLLLILACIPLYSRAADYCFVPDKLDGTKALNAACCSTPHGWQGWKDDTGTANHQSSSDRSSLYGDQTYAVGFFKPNCTVRPECPHLRLETFARSTRGQPDSTTGLQTFLNELKRHKDSNRDPDPVVSRFGKFNDGKGGILTIWEVRSAFYDDYFVAMIAHADVLVRIYLQAADSNQLVNELDSLKELARSVKITAATLLSPDRIRIDIKGTDAVIRQQLLQLTPIGMALNEAHELLRVRLLTRTLSTHETDGVRRVDDNLQAELGNYWDGKATTEVEAGGERHSVPAPTVVAALWKFDKNQRLRDIEIRRLVQGTE
jgi:hypothetical protein